MKVSPEQTAVQNAAPQAVPIRLLNGLVGFPNYQSFEVLVDPEQLPFMWMRLQGPDGLDFVVIEPGGIIANYEVELFDEDADLLGIQTAEDATILNIVTVRPGANATATVNLTAPVVINRHRGIAKQCILQNHARYSAFHPLVGGDANEVNRQP
jgi:flagellar assembly factor FliW